MNTILLLVVVSCTGMQCATTVPESWINPTTADLASCVQMMDNLRQQDDSRDYICEVRTNGGKE